MDGNPADPSLDAPQEDLARPSGDAPTLGPRTARVLGALALLYFRHGDPGRALALGLAAMRAGPPSTRLVLLLAATFLKVGDPEQALAALSRLDADGEAQGDLLAAPPTPAEAGAADVLRAKALHRRGEGEAARAALEAGRARLAQTGEGA